MRIKRIASFCLLYFLLINNVLAVKKHGVLKSIDRNNTINLISVNLDTFPNVGLVFQIQNQFKEPIWGLQANEIRVFENNKTCEVLDLKSLTNRIPLKINLIIDNSNSMLYNENYILDEYGNEIYFNERDYVPPIESAKKAAINFAKKFNYNFELISVNSFSSSYVKILNFSNEKKKIIGAINSIKLDGGTALYDALYESVNSKSEISDTLLINIILTDGQDNSSSKTVEDLMENKLFLETPTYIIGLGDVDSLILKNISNKTNGAYYGVNNANSLNEIYDKIYDNISSYYVVNFKSDNIKTIDSIVDYSINYITELDTFKSGFIQKKLPDNVKNYIISKSNYNTIEYLSIFIVAVGLSIYFIRKTKNLKNV